MNRSLDRYALVTGLLLSATVYAAPTDLDTSFGGSGDRLDPFVSANLVTRLDGRALAVSSAQLSYIAGGANGGAGLEEGFLGVLNTNGSIATQINGSGLTLLPQARFEDLLLLPDGKVLACGLSYVSQTDYRWLVARFNANLSLDATFAGQGFVVGDFGPLSICETIEQTSDARIVIGGRRGSSNQGPQDNGFIAVLTQSGTLDTAFAGTGLIETAVDLPGFSGTFSPRVASLTEGADGRVVMAGGLGISGPDGLMNTINRDYVMSYAPGGTRVHLRNPRDTAFYLPWTRSWGELHAAATAKIRRGYQFVYQQLPPNRAYTYVGGYEADLSNPAGSTTGIWGGLAWPNTEGELDGHLYGASALLPNDQMIVAGSWRRSGQSPAQARVFLQRVDQNGLDSSFFPVVGFNQDAYLHRPAGQPETGATPFPIVRDLAVSRNGRITILSRRSSGQNGINVMRFLGDPIVNSTIDLDPDPSGLVPGSASVSPNVMATSDLMAIFGLAAGARVPLFVLGGEYQVNSGGWRSQPTFVGNGDFVRVRGRSPATQGAQQLVSLFVGGLRAKNSWDALGARQRADFVITTASTSLVGTRCSAVAGATNCMAAIPDNSGSVTSVLPLNYIVPGQCNFIRRVRVGLDIDHPYVGDLRVVLQDPNFDSFGGPGNVTLLDRTRNGVNGTSGSCGADDIEAIFWDDSPVGPDRSCGLIPDRPALNGYIAPVQPLSGLIARRSTDNNGSSTVGTWRLVVRDLANGDVGQLNDWSIEVDCSSTPVLEADIEVTTIGNTSGIAGTPLLFGFQVRNLGPQASGPVRFTAPLPSGAVAGYTDVSWSCTATGGATCNYPPFCGPLSCSSSTLESELSLPAGAMVEFNITATIGAALAPSQAVDTTALAVITGGSSADPIVSNNSSTHSLAPIHFADLRAEALSAQVVPGNQIEIVATFASHGPSFTPNSAHTLTLPAGYSFASESCARAGSACGGVSFTNGQQLVRDTLPLLGDGAANVWIIRASYAGATPPVGQIVLASSLPGGMGVGDPNLSNNTQTIATPTGGLPDPVFANGFE
ncbi:MAG: hypothetical protein R3F18_15305 [Lysobacterales bacterium]